MMLPYVHPHAGESLVSWSARAAQVQTRMTLPQLANFVGMDRADFLCPDLDGMTRVETLFGERPDDPKGTVFVQQASDMVRHRSEIFRSDFLSWRISAFCPLCIHSDVQVYGRTHWHLETGLTCGTHNSPLLRAALASPDDIFALPSSLYPAGDALDRLCADCLAQTVSPLQIYVENRLAGTAGPGWMDAQRIDQVARAARMLGSLTLHGPTFRLSAMTDAQVNDADAIGYSCFSGGPQAVWSGLDDILGDARRQSRDSKPQRAFGTFFRWLEKTPDAGPIRDLAIEFVMENFALDAGTVVLGTTVEARRKHSAASLASTFGLSRKIASTAARQVGLMCEGATVHSAFDAVRGEAIATDLKASVPANSVASYLGCDPYTAAAIVAGGHAVRVLADFPLPESRRSKAIKGVTTSSLDDLMAQMLERATPIDSLSLYVEPIGKAAKHLHWQADKIIRLIMNGKVPLFCLPGRQDFDALCVDLQDFRWVMSAPVMSTCLSKKKAAAELGVDVHTIELLMRVARMDGTPLLRRVQPMSGKRANLWHVFEEDFIEFQAAHVALVELAKENSIPPSEMEANLNDLGIRPIMVSNRSHYRFYRRSDL